MADVLEHNEDCGSVDRIQYYLLISGRICVRPPEIPVQRYDFYVLHRGDDGSVRHYTDSEILAF